MEWTDAIPWTISLISLILCIITFIRNGHKDLKTDVKEDASKMEAIRESLLKVNLKLDQVCATTTETRSDIKAMNRDIQAIDIRVSVLERDLKTAFNLIDGMKEERKV